MSIMYRLDRRGHGNLATWRIGDKMSVDAARRVFDEHKAAGYKAFVPTDNDGDGEIIKVFDPTLTEIALMPQMQGG